MPGPRHRRADQGERDRRREDPPCAVCGKGDDCICPECPVCEGVGDPACYEKHGMVRTDEQVRSLAEAEAAWSEERKAEEAMYEQWLEDDKLAREYWASQSNEIG